jgi:hypothetical protein
MVPSERMMTPDPSPDEVAVYTEIVTMHGRTAASRHSPSGPPGHGIVRELAA